jgi:hypothetical protein
MARHPSHDEKPNNDKPEHVSGASAPPPVATPHEDPPPVTVRPNAASPTSEKLASITTTHAAALTADELTVMHAAEVELKAYEASLVVIPPVEPAAPVNRDVPYAEQLAGELRCTMGNWDGEPTTYEYGWHRDGTFVVGGPDMSSYTVMTEDVGTTFTCVVTATNAQGATAAPPSNPVVVAAP